MRVGPWASTPWRSGVGLRAALAIGVVVVLCAGPLASVASAKTLTVTTAADTGSGSLRLAISQANAISGGDTIRFDIPKPGVQVIQLTTALPVITDPVRIAGQSQPGYAGTPLIRLLNKTGNQGAIGLDVQTVGSSVAGLSITGFGTGIRISSGTGNVLSRDWIGITPAGTKAPNHTGVTVKSASNLIGSGNVISGNVKEGVLVTGPTATGNTVAGNMIGTNPAGTAAVANGIGVSIASSATSTTVGGAAAGSGNLISGNTYGVVIAGALTTSNLVQGNRIGTDAAAAVPLPNGAGVTIRSGANANLVGGTVPEAANIISGNARGVDITGTGTSNNTVEGNLLGIDASGTMRVPNEVGVEIETGASANHIGTASPGARNVISASIIAVEMQGVANNTVEGNYIGTDVTGGVGVYNFVGVLIGPASHDNLVGGTSPGAGNVLADSTNEGVAIQGTANTVAGNLIGTDATGTHQIHNFDGGVVISGDATANVIGGTVPGARNVISGNTKYGVAIFGDFATGKFPTGNTVAGNYIGTDVTGSARLSNGTGVFIVNNANGNTIGGTTPGAGNVISGNAGDGVDLAAIGNLVAGNLIGTDADGLHALGNNVGVRVESPSTIGGTTPGARNVISGNTHQGILIATDSTGVHGNYIGTDRTGLLPVPNEEGIQVGVQLTQTIESVIGGTAPGARNVISGNTVDGVHLWGGGITLAGNRVEGNYIGTTPQGDTALGNGIGILLDGAARGVKVGGTSAGAGNLISGNVGAGVELANNGTSGNTFQGNFVGTDAAGTAPLGNTMGFFVHDSAGPNTIGGSGAGARNVISGNLEQGIAVADGSGNVIQGNAIGSDPTGSTAVPNTTGVDLFDGARSNTVGGTSNGEGNLVSGNNGAGVALRDPGTSGNLVRGNLIGTNAAGSAALPNAIGVVVGGGASSNSIGGATASARNTISGNTLGGVFIAGDATTGNHVDRNAIGTAAAGGAGVPNGVGIEIAGSSGNHVGDGSAARANTIRFNTGSGVVVDAADGPANGNSVLANSIDSNGGLGINLLNGANDEQAAPEITSVLTFFQTTIQGTISGSPSTGYRIEVFSGPDCDPSGSGEGRAFRGFTEISTNTDGNASFSVDVPSLAHGLAVTATATSDDGSTSEFSACELSP